jgi:dTDP-4-amino-4,6-dideoxygalactose transaminase
MIPFFRPYISSAMTEAVQACLASGWLNEGPWTGRFEQALQTYTQSDAVLAVSSNTVGLELALRWLGIGPGDEVIVPVYSYCVSAHAVLYTGATPVFWACGPDFLPDVHALGNLITPKTRAIITVDLGGRLCNYPEIEKVLADHPYVPENEIQEHFSRIPVIADTAHSIGGRLLTKPAGSWADISVFSFHSAKNITTGDGGAIAFNLPKSFSLPDVLSWFRQMRIHGKSKVARSDSAAGNFGYDVILPGIKANMTDMQASLGLAQLEVYEDELLPDRRRMAEVYFSLLNGHEEILLPPKDSIDNQSAWHLFLVRIPGIAEVHKYRMMEEASKAGVGFSHHYPLITSFTLYRKLGYHPSATPHSSKFSVEEITLPLYHGLSTDDQSKVVEVLMFEIQKWRRNL